MFRISFEESSSFANLLDRNSTIWMSYAEKMHIGQRFPFVGLRFVIIASIGFCFRLSPKNKQHTNRNCNLPLSVSDLIKLFSIFQDSVSNSQLLKAIFDRLKYISF